MWFTDNRPTVDWSTAQAQLARADPIMRRIIKQVGPCTLRPRRDYFVKLCQSIFTQQISTAVATILFERFRNYFPGRRPTPALVLNFLQGDDATIRAVGLSRQKRGYVEDLARHFATGQVRTRAFASMDDEAIVQALLPIKGIGRWTVEMFLIFCLNRPDVFPIDDLGVRVNAGRAHGLAQIPTKPELLEMGERWRPWRTIASWYLWRYGDIHAAEAKVITAAASSAPATRRRTS